jgi:hypothetical protein
MPIKYLLFDIQEDDIMDSSEALKRIREIVFSVPGEVYKFTPPEECFEEEWQEASSQEKAFLLIEELLINLNKENTKKKQNNKVKDVVQIKLSEGPRFFSNADENMFFNALYSVPAVIEIKGNLKELIISCRDPLSIEEKDFLKGLFKRYQVSIPDELGN